MLDFYVKKKSKEKIIDNISNIINEIIEIIIEKIEVCLVLPL